MTARQTFRILIVSKSGSGKPTLAYGLFAA